MLPILRNLARKLIPGSVRLRLHYFRRYKDYVFVKREDLGYGEDGFYTTHAAPFLDDARFVRAYQLGEETRSWQGLAIRWRAHVACWFAEYASGITGDFVECGVNRGGLARAIVDYTNFGRTDKQFYLIDTFSGLVPDYLSPSEHSKGLMDVYSYYKDNAKEHVAQTFLQFPNIRIVEGVVPDVLRSLPITSVAFLSLDMNCTMPEIRAAEFYWDKMSPGGVILLDDYGQTFHVEQQQAFDRFAEQRGTTVLALPTGQGVIVKPPASRTAVESKRSASGS